ncbi:MAG: hypothetical protein EOM20_08980 [Spartobacteria bacterium]|nr:hypothetical protein [Spartobacteria bacterium]
MAPHSTRSDDDRQAGIILSAGASTRMGAPKALLSCRDGYPLILHQARLLLEANHDPVCLVFGAGYPDILANLSALPYVTLDIQEGIRSLAFTHNNQSYPCLLGYNPRWADGRFTSVQTGLTLVFDDPTVAGCTILPVDTVGIAVDTLRDLRHEAQRIRPQALRPVCKDQKGKVIWLSRPLGQALLTLPPIDTRLDQWLADRETPWATNDTRMLNNINTPAQWSEYNSGQLF